MLGGAALRRVLGFVLVVVGLVVFNDVVLTAEESYYTCKETVQIKGSPKSSHDMSLTSNEDSSNMANET